MARKEAKEQRDVARETAGHVGHVAKQDTMAASCSRGGNKNLYATGEGKVKPVKKQRTDNEKELQA